MKTIRKEFPKVRQYVKAGNTYYQVDLRRKGYKGTTRKNFTDRKMALAFAANIGDKVSANGMLSIATAQHEEQIRVLAEQCAVYGKTLDEAIQVALDMFAKELAVKQSPYMAELLSVWIDDKITGLKKLRPKSVKSIRNMANMFKTDFGMVRIKEIDEQRIEDYLKSKTVTDQTRENIRNYLSQFFNWSIKRKYHDKNPAEDIEIEISRGSPEFFTVGQCETLLKTAMIGEHRALLPYLALGFFAGIRPEECERMTWQNVKMDPGEIYLTAAITKTKKDRIFSMPLNLVAWLEHCKDVVPLVPPSNLQNMRVRLCKAANVVWIADGLRHSFATYHYAKEKNLETLRHIMGNSPNIIERFYKGAISKGEVEKYWSITPTSQPQAA